jgi:polyphosphate kinase 2 (PPK2 family)
VHEVPSLAGPHRHHQPQLLRGNAGRPGGSGIPGEAAPPSELVTKDIWEQRFQDIRTFERYLTRSGDAGRKFLLHVSNKEQRKRFLSRIEEPEKNWKFSANDATEREHWDEYMGAYEDTIRNTATKRAPVVCRARR